MLSEDTGRYGVTGNPKLWVTRTWYINVARWWWYNVHQKELVFGVATNGVVAWLCC